MKIADIFRTTGQPTITYVPRDSGHYERRLNSYLDEKGQLCLITGPSKTGKSTLYKRVLEERGQIPLVVQCTSERTATEMWKVALEQVNFDRVKSISEVGTSKINSSVDVATKFGWKWLAEISGKFTGGLTQEFSETKIREREYYLKPLQMS